MTATITIPRTYTEKITLPATAGPKHAPVKSTYTGKRAPQLTSGTTRIVARRSRRLSRLRVAITAGTLHPNPINSGMKLLPCRPILCMKRSMRNAARAMYPVSSRNAIARNRSRMLGRKTTTPPTPAITPSTISERRYPSGRRLPTTDPSQANPASIQCLGGSPALNVS